MKARNIGKVTPRTLIKTLGKSNPYPFKWDAYHKSPNQRVKSNSGSWFNSNQASTKKSLSRSPTGSKNFLLKRNSVSPVTSYSLTKIWQSINNVLILGKLANMNDSSQSTEKKVDDIVDAIERIGQTMIFNQSW